MKTLLRTTLITTAALALSLSARAQVLTANTISGFDPGTSYTSGIALADNQGITQTFTNVTSVESVNFTFLALTGASFAATTMDVYLSNWSGTQGIGPAGGSTILGTLTIASTDTWVAAGGSHISTSAGLNLSSATGLLAGSTYGLSLVGTTSSAAAGFRLGLGGSDYTDGSRFTSAGTIADGAGGYTSFQSNPGSSVGGDFAFTATLATVPEASNVAVLFAGLFVSSLMLRRQRHLRPSMVTAA